MTKKIEIDKTRFLIQIWDTAGQETFKSITKGYYKSSACTIMTYDISNRLSFEHIKDWLNDCNELCPRTITKVLVGNKNDLSESRQVPMGEGRKFAEENKCYFFEVSALTGENIEDVFLLLKRCFIQA
jgi:small GTP-binding protein